MFQERCLGIRKVRAHLLLISTFIVTALSFALATFATFGTFGDLLKGKL